MKTFISDLDGTLIYSREPAHKCVEYKEGKEITYMTETASNNMDKLLKEVLFVPCSMRNKQQIERVEFIKEYSPKYMIACNGACIYVDGEKDECWERYIRKIIPNDEIAKLAKVIEEQNLPTTLIYNADGYSLAISFESKETAAYYVDKLKQFAPSKDYLVYSINRKVYFINKNINKVHAVEYLCSKYHLENVFTAGDSLVDKEFNSLPYVKAILPNHAVFDNDSAIRTSTSGIEAGNEIIEKILSL